MSFFLKKNKTSIRSKVMVNLGLTILVFIVGYQIFFTILNRKNNLTLRFQEQELSESLHTILEIHSDTYRKMVYDYSVFSWMIDFIKNPARFQPEMTISHPQNLGLSFIEVVNLKKEIVYTDKDPDWKDAFFTSPAFLDSLYLKRQYSFFIKVPSGIVQIFASTVHPSLDLHQETTPRGFVIFGKYWDEKYMNDLQKTINGKIVLNAQVNDMEADGIVRLPLKDYLGNSITVLEISKKYPFMENLHQLNLYLKFFFVVFCLVLFVIIYLTYNNLVISPLNKIRRSLNLKSSRPIQELAKTGNEFGKVADLISTFFKQQNELQQKIKELNIAQGDLRQLNEELIKQKQELEKQYDQMNYLNDEMQSQNEEIVAIAEGLQVANKEVTDSINYASIVQNAVLASSAEISHMFPEHFIFFKPKNIVSGDFYWFKKMNNGDRIVAVADCTGHGLSGALLSMLGISFLNQIVSQLQGNEFSAAAILGKLKEFFIESLHQVDSMEDVQDGMHIALFILDEESKKMQYATAFHSINMVRFDPITGKPAVIEFKGNRIPVGIYIMDEEFVNYEIEVQKGDLIYMYSDGITDQFGGSANKKYMSTKFKQFLLSVCDLPLEMQKYKIINEFENWKAYHDQTDDVIVIGLKIQ